MLKSNQAGKHFWNYPSAARATHYVASQTAKFLNSAFSLGLNSTQVHIVGFSLGAHVGGFAGNIFNGKISRVTGLDPAG